MSAAHANEDAIANTRTQDQLPRFVHLVSFVFGKLTDGFTPNPSHLPRYTSNHCAARNCTHATHPGSARLPRHTRNTSFTPRALTRPIPDPACHITNHNTTRTPQHARCTSATHLGHACHICRARLRGYTNLAHLLTWPISDPTTSHHVRRISITPAPPLSCLPRLHHTRSTFVMSAASLSHPLHLCHVCHISITPHLSRLPHLHPITPTPPLSCLPHLHHTPPLLHLHLFHLSCLPHLHITPAHLCSCLSHDVKFFIFAYVHDVMINC